MGAGTNKIPDSTQSSTDKLKFSRVNATGSVLQKAGLVRDAENRTLLQKADD
ncbi:hypothetical protein [Methylotuvimicrobium sp. KM2]|jgi:hypothetical protein|uniref:hypothetical protein n=1 Tax=Methylotuvimicrobium sp. KM2 TaxID=3133976 RepID=UPI003100CABF